MARSTRAAKKVSTPAPDETEEATGRAPVERGPGEMHELFSEWLAEETGVTVSPEHIFLVTSKRTAFRKSDAYLEYQEAKDAVRATTPRATKADPEPEPESEEEGDEETPAPRRGRRGALKVVQEEAEETPAPAPVSTRRGRRGAAKAAPAEESAPVATGRRRRGGRVATEPAF